MENQNFIILHEFGDTPLTIFHTVSDQINVEARKAVHVGDDVKADRVGANTFGIDCW